MPHKPSEEVTESHIFDSVAKGSSESSTASDHPIHDTQHKEENKDGPQESIQIHSGKGPQIPDEMPEKASKDDLKARAAELNK